MIKLEATPESIPWQPDCLRCENYSTLPEPEVVSWLLAIGMHFRADHHILLVMPS